MIQLPEHDWSKANGWVVRNLIEHGNSMVPKVTVESLIDLFGANWRPVTEEILTRILLAKNVLEDDQRVWLERKNWKENWQAKWYG